MGTVIMKYKNELYEEIERLCYQRDAAHVTLMAIAETCDGGDMDADDAYAAVVKVAGILVKHFREHGIPEVTL